MDISTLYKSVHCQVIVTPIPSCFRFTTSFGVSWGFQQKRSINKAILGRYQVQSCPLSGKTLPSDHAYFRLSYLHNELGGPNLLAVLTFSTSNSMRVKRITGVDIRLGFGFGLLGFNKAVLVT